MDFIVMAETLEAQAAALRRHAATLANEGQASLELDDSPDHEWRDHDGGEQPAPTYGKNVDIRTRDKAEFTLPANAVNWSHHDDSGDVLQWRISAEQPAE